MGEKDKIYKVQWKNMSLYEDVNDYPFSSPTSSHPASHVGAFHISESRTLFWLFWQGCSMANLLLVSMCV